MNVITAEISDKIDEAIYGDRPKNCKLYLLPEEQNISYGFSINDSVFVVKLLDENLTILYGCHNNIGFELNEGKLYDFNNNEYVE